MSTNLTKKVTLHWLKTSRKVSFYNFANDIQNWNLNSPSFSAKKDQKEDFFLLERSLAKNIKGGGRH